MNYILNTWKSQVNVEFLHLKKKSLQKDKDCCKKNLMFEICFSRLSRSHPLERFLWKTKQEITSVTKNGEEVKSLPCWQEYKMM